MKSFVPLFLAISTLQICSGCGGGPEGAAERPACTPVSGVVTLNGTPVEGATVGLHPETQGHGAFGITDQAGKFVLTTFEKGDGAVPANYKISVRKLEETKSTAAGMDSPGYDPNAPEVAPKDLLPVKYSQFIKSGLSITVGETPITDLKLELTE